MFGWYGNEQLRLPQRPVPYRNERFKDVVVSVPRGLTQRRSTFVVSGVHINIRHRNGAAMRDATQRWWRSRGCSIRQRAAVFAPMLGKKVSGKCSFKNCVTLDMGEGILEQQSGVMRPEKGQNRA